MSSAPLKTSTAFLSTRISIAWLPDPPSEPTDTLVLTGTKYYVDLRTLKEDGSLDWGMAGVKELVGGTKEKPIARFTNILDSHLPSSSSSNPTASSADPSSSSSAPPPPLPDEGAFSLLPSGNTLEAGTMVNPATSLPQLYEEEWAPVPVPRGEDVLILQSVSSSLGQAFVGVCGKWALGVYETKDGGYGGWKANKEGDIWTLVWSLGEEKVGWVGEEVEEWTTVSSSWREGDEVDWAGRSWKVLEHSLMGEGRPK